MRRKLGWACVGVALAVGAAWAVTTRYALVWSTMNTIGRVYGGKIVYGGYEYVRMDAQWPEWRLERRNPTDSYGLLCHEKQVTVRLWWVGAPAAACAGVTFVIVAFAHRAHFRSSDASAHAA